MGTWGYNATEYLVWYCTGGSAAQLVQGWFGMRRVPVIWDFADECLSAHTIYIIVLPPDPRTAVQNPDPKSRRAWSTQVHKGTPPIPLYCDAPCIAIHRSLNATLFY